MITSPRLPIALLAGSLTLGCAGLTPPLTPPERGGAPWTELTSKHFVVDTDVDAAEAGSTLAEFEGIYGAIEDVAFPSQTESRAPIRVVLFGREKDYRLFGAKDTRGYFTPQLPNDLDVVDDVAHGKKLEAAWATRFDGVDPDKLEGDFREHLIRTESIEAQAWTTPYTPRARAVPEQQRALSPAEVHVLWARLRPWDEQHLPMARTDINAARAADPTSPEIQYWSGLFLRAEGDREGAEAELSRALAQRPNDARYLLALGTHYRGLERNAPKDRLDDVMHRLAKVAVAPRALDFVASYDAATGEIDEGLRFAARATKADPACYRCFSTGARLLAAKGRLDEAVDAALRALNLVPDGVRAPQLTRDLARYRSERDRARTKAE